MTRRIGRWAGVVGVGLIAVAGPVRGVDGQHAGSGHRAGGPDHDGHLIAQRCTTEFEQVIADGRGFGLAFAADQNGYPGPLHVLELRARLALTPEQERRAQTLLQAMFADAGPKSARLLAAEDRLRRVFAGGHADDASVRAAVAEVERARNEVRLVHLLTHLRTRELLTEEQRRLYHQARWAH